MELSTKLAPHEIEVIQTLPALHRDYVILRQEKPISQLEPYTIKRACRDIIAISYTEMSPNGVTDEKIISAQAELLLQELKGKYSQLTLSELKSAFKRGIRGDSGQYFGLCPKTYHQFIKWFFELPERSEAWVSYLQGIEGKRVDKPVVLTKDFLKASAQKAFIEYKEIGKLPMIAHAIYDTIKELTGAETLIESEKWLQIQTEAKESYTESFKLASGRKITGLVFELTNRSYEFHIKKIGLKYYFDKLIFEGKNLEL